MTRFNISLDEAVRLVVHAIKNAKGGEIFVPKIPSYRLVDLAKAISPKSKIKFTGIRPGEKLHEEMISFSESTNTISNEKFFIILPSFRNYTIDKYIKKNSGKKISKGFMYRSDTNKDFLSVSQIRKVLSGKLIKK